MNIPNTKIQFVALKICLFKLHTSRITINNLSKQISCSVTDFIRLVNETFLCIKTNFNKLYSQIKSVQNNCIQINSCEYGYSFLFFFINVTLTYSCLFPFFGQFQIWLNQNVFDLSLFYYVTESIFLDFGLYFWFIYRFIYLFSSWIRRLEIHYRVMTFFCLHFPVSERTFAWSYEDGKKHSVPLHYLFIQMSSLNINVFYSVWHRRTNPLEISPFDITVIRIENEFIRFGSYKNQWSHKNAGYKSHRFLSR